MTVEVKPQFILVSDIIDGHLVKEKFIGYSVSEAKKQFNINREEDEAFARKGINNPHVPYEREIDFQK